MHATPQDRHAAEGAQRVLEAFAASAHIQFDRIVAGRVLSESGRAITGDDAGTWARRLVEAGESLNLRVRYVECTLADAMTFVQQGIPVAHCSSAGDGTLHWFSPHFVVPRSRLAIYLIVQTTLVVLLSFISRGTAVSFGLIMALAGETVGMLSVNGYSGAVWPHTWHGTLLAAGME